MATRGANGSDTDRIVVKPYPYPFFFSDTDTDRIVDGYGSDIRFSILFFIIMVNNINFFIIYIKLYGIYLLFGYG